MFILFTFSNKQSFEPDFQGSDTSEKITWKINRNKKKHAKARKIIGFIWKV
jgi:hypothetical protein